MSKFAIIHATTFWALFLSGAAFYFLPCAQSSEPDFVGSFRYVKGVVTLESKKNQSRQNAQKDMQFFEGDKIVTQQNSFALLSFQDGSTIKIEPNSELTIISLIGKSEKGYFGVSRLLLAIGGVMVDVVKKFTGPPSVEIETKKGIAFGVRGTKFYTFIEPNSEDIWTVVLEGEVQAFDFPHDDSESIPESTSIVAIEGEQLTIPQEYRWVKKISWNNDPSQGELDSGLTTIAQERQNELAQVLKKILDRKRKPFINSERNPRKMKDRTLREIKETVMEEKNAVDSTSSALPSTLNALSGPGTSGEFAQHTLPSKIKAVLQQISEQNPNTPKPIATTEQNGNNLAQATCQKVTPSGFPCLVREGFCLGEEVSAAIFFTKSHVYNVCVKIINGFFL